MGLEQIAKFRDCQIHSPDSESELFIVEGDSAAESVAAVCDRKYQAVLPLQGKPPNAAKASKSKIASCELFNAIRYALGFDQAGEIDPKAARFSKTIFLFDPDADGIHCGALTLIYFHRQLKPLLEAGCVSMIESPQFRLRWLDGLSGKPQALLVYNSQDLALQMQKLRKQQAIGVAKTHYRGLASLEHEVLYEACVDPHSRRIHRLGVGDAEAVISMFG